MIGLVIWGPKSARREPKVPRAMHPTKENCADVRTTCIPADSMIFQNIKSEKWDSYQDVCFDGLPEILIFEAPRDQYSGLRPGRPK